MQNTVLITYCVAALVASLVGGSLPSLLRLTHSRLQMALSFVAGLMLGMALLHLIPHAAHHLGSLDRTVQCALVGFLVMFILQRLFHYHQHELPPAAKTTCCASAQAEPASDTRGRITWIGTFTGLGLHSILDGLALAAAVAAESGHRGVVGLGAALAVILHKPFDAMAVTTLMHSGHASRRTCLLANLVFALITPVGVTLFVLGLRGLTEANETVVGYAVAFCAGTFLCIACSDLLPELHFHTHDRLKLSVALAAGLGVSILVGHFETAGHDHHHAAEQHPELADHPDGDH